MIAKHIAMRSAKRSSFAGLAAYVTSAHGKNERVGAVMLTNFMSNDDIALAVTEAQVTQGRNITAKGDKTYHLVVSFAPGEQPSAMMLKDIEDRLCTSIGLGEHQRISAVHHDTDIMHLHIAVNKVHPTRHILVEPFRAYWRLGETCSVLEREHGLMATNHHGVKRAGENRADDMAQASGIEPLRDWIRRTCLDEMRAATSWRELHAVATANGLTIAERGAGLVITGPEGVAIKPSTVARELARGALEKRLGAFERSSGDAAPAQTRRYEKRPERTRLDTTALFARYKRENEAARTVRTAALAEARARRDRAVEDAKRRGRLERATIALSGQGKRVSYGVASRRLMAAIGDARTRYAREAEAIGRAARPRTWADWLQNEAGRGHAEALAALRARAKAKAKLPEGVAIDGATVAAAALPGATLDSITKKGTIIFHSPGAAVRDDGARLSVSRGADSAAVAAALAIARARYGDTLHIEGSAEFRRRVAAVAAMTMPEVRFRDAAMERQRAGMAQTWQEHGNGRAGRGPRIDGGNGAGLGGAAIDGGARTPVARAGQLATFRGGASQPDLGRVGRGPPPERQNRLRGLSELGVVRVGERAEMLLPGDVPGQLEQPGAERADRVRRPIRGTGVTPDAADRYIAERNAKRGIMEDIREHVRYTGGNETLRFAGVRTVDGVRLALFERDGTIAVKPIDDVEADALPRQLGRSVRITEGRVAPGRGIGRSQ